VAGRSENSALLARHWLRAEDWEKALSHTLEAAERALSLNACPEAVNHFWQVLDLLERLSPTPERGLIRINVVQKLYELPGWRRNDPGEARLLRHFDLALADAVNEPVSTMVRLESMKGVIWSDEALLVGAIARAERSGDTQSQAFAALRCGNYLGMRDRLDRALGHIAQAIAIMGDRGERLQQGFIMASQGRCFFARAGRLEESLAYAARAREAGDALDNGRLCAWRAMEAETYLYKGHWAEAVFVAEEALPMAWKTGEWDVVLWSSAWAATACLKLGRLADARSLLHRALNEVPVRGQRAWTVAVAQIALAQVNLIATDVSQALRAALRALDLSEQDRQRLEIGAAHRVLGQVHEALGDRAEADAAFQPSIEVLEEIQSRPELAQTLLAYGRFRRGDHPLEDRAMIERALALFEAMGATGWIEEARGARFPIARSGRPPVTLNGIWGGGFHGID
jgi:tetratricopeptide (TPR) repeat protein